MSDTLKKNGLVVVACTLILSLTGCTFASENAQINDSAVVVSEQEVSSVDNATNNTTTENATAQGTVTSANELFTDREMEQTYDSEEAIYYTLESNQEIVIDEEGVYVFSGDVTETTILVEADDEAKVQLVLDGVSIINEDMPAIYVKSADKVFVTTTDSDNYLEMSGQGTTVDDNNLDAVIFSKDDIVFGGLGTIEIVSVNENGISAKDDLKITGGTMIVTAEADGLEANDSIRIIGGDIIIDSNKDAMHAENDEDDSLGFIYIDEANIFIIAGDDAIRGTSYVQIDGGTIEVETCVEGIEATYIQINDGTIDIYATDDGINATSKSSAYDVLIEVYGGIINVVMASGDTDGFDSNGNLTIYDGTISVEAVSAFDADGTIEWIDGDITVNGEAITEIVESQMGGQMGGRMGGSLDGVPEDGFPTDGFPMDDSMDGRPDKH